jgi:hypothetical protein
MRRRANPRRTMPCRLVASLATSGAGEQRPGEAARLKADASSFPFAHKAWARIRKTMTAMVAAAIAVTRRFTTEGIEDPPLGARAIVTKFLTRLGRP